MHHIHKALVLIWLLILILFALSAPGEVAGAWIMLAAIAALGIPLILILFRKPRYGRSAHHHRSPH